MDKELLADIDTSDEEQSDAESAATPQIGEILSDDDSDNDRNGQLTDTDGSDMDE